MKKERLGQVATAKGRPRVSVGKNKGQETERSRMLSPEMLTCVPSQPMVW